MNRGIDVAELAREHYTLVYRFCARRVGTDLASDLAQETFLTAQRAAGGFRGASSASTWLLGIAHNECRRAIRKQRLDPPPLLLEPSSGDDPAGAVIDRQALSDALERLSPEHREVVLLHEVEQLTYEEAAKVLRVPVGTVKSRLHHAFANLRRSLNGGAA
jgi:RNA polymerase sigma-70 factor (ECF subfamily)